MVIYSLKRIAGGIFILAGVSILAFLLGVMAPGDPAEFVLNQNGLSDPTEAQILAMREELGLNRPLYQQYISWLINILQGDFGTSYITSRSIDSEIVLRLPVTVQLACMAFMFAACGGIIAGIICAVYQNSFFDNAIKNITNVMLAVPGFWLALLLILIFSEKLHLLPTSGSDSMINFIMPAAVVSFSAMATICRYMRGAMINEFSKQYFIVAAVRGLSRFKLLFVYALPNALIPVIAMLGNYFAGILGGSVIAESIFALPGISNMALEAIRFRDYPVLQGYVLVTGSILIFITIAVDVIIAYINPKIKLGD